MLKQEIRQSSKVAAAFLSGFIFAMAGLTFLMARHIMHKAVGVCLIALLVSGFAVLSYVIDVLHLRHLRDSGLLGMMNEWESVRINFRNRGTDLDTSQGAAIPATAKSVFLSVKKRDGQHVGMRLPAAYAGKLQQAIRQHFPDIRPKGI